MAGKKFLFSLERVLTLRRYETERAQQHLGQVTQDRQEQEARVQDLQDRLLNVPAASVGVIDPAALRRQSGFREDAQQRYDQACTALASHQHLEEQARERLREKHGAEESLHLLREREEAAHKKEQADAEGAFLDEQALSGYTRKQNGR